MRHVPRDTSPRDTSLMHALSSSRVRPATCIVNGVSNAAGTRVVKVACALVADTGGGRATVAEIGGGRATVAEIGTGCRIPGASTPSDMACSCDVGAIASVTATTSGFIATRPKRQYLYFCTCKSVSICTFVPAEERPVSLAWMQGNHLIEQGLTHQTLLLITVE